MAKERITERITDEFVFFHGGPLSNWHRCSIWVPTDSGNLEFRSSEQLFMYIKARTFNDFEAAQKILECTTPREAKELGRQVKGFDESAWERVRESVMLYAVSYKFKNPDLRQYLLSSKFSGKSFVEGSPTDRVWGIGVDWRDSLADDKKNWRGMNLLGKCLDKVRQNINNIDLTIY